MITNIFAAPGGIEELLYREGQVLSLGGAAGLGRYDDGIDACWCTARMGRRSWRGGTAPPAGTKHDS